MEKILRSVAQSFDKTTLPDKKMHKNVINTHALAQCCGDSPNAGLNMRADQKKIRDSQTIGFRLLQTSLSFAP